MTWLSFSGDCFAYLNMTYLGCAGHDTRKVSSSILRDVWHLFGVSVALAGCGIPKLPWRPVVAMMVEMGVRARGGSSIFPPHFSGLYVCLSNTAKPRFILLRMSHLTGCNLLH